MHTTALFYQPTYFTKMHAIVIGANSYIGQHLVQKLLNHGHSVTAVVNHHRLQTQWLCNTPGVDVLVNPQVLDTRKATKVFFCDLPTSSYPATPPAGAQYDQYLNQKSIVLSTTNLSTGVDSGAASLEAYNTREAKARIVGAGVVRLCNVIGWNLPEYLKKVILGPRMDLQSIIRRHLLKANEINEVFYFSKALNSSAHYVDVDFACAVMASMLRYPKVINVTTICSDKPTTLQEIGEALPCNFSSSKKYITVLTDSNIFKGTDKISQTSLTNITTVGSLSRVFYNAQ
jgi:nucleoside-diphosphate-sugar epimerase